MKIYMRPLGLSLVLGLTILGAQESQLAGSGSAPELKITRVDRETKEISEKSVLQSGLVSGGQRANGIRAYAFELLAGEELKVEMVSDDNALVLQFLFPTTPNSMTPAIRAANQPPKALRQKKIHIKNPTAQAQEAILLVGGPMNYAFTLKHSYSRR
jgi:hypothetical protein